MSHCVYCLLSDNHDKTYIGYTINFKRRIKEHNTHKKGYTSRYSPWKCLYIIEKLEKKEATRLEQFIKHKSGVMGSGLERQKHMIKLLQTSCRDKLTVFDT